MDSLLEYLAQRLQLDRGYGDADIPEAKPLEAPGRRVLARPDVSLTVAVLIDRAQEPLPGGALTPEALLAVGKECTKYCGALYGSRMPAGIQLYVVGSGPMSDAEWERWRSLSRRMPGRDKVQIAVWYVDAAAGTARSTLPFNGALAGGRWLRKLMREPRLAAEEMGKRAALDVGTDGPPRVTYLLCGFLTLLFGMEYLLPIGPARTFAPSVPTLLALGADTATLVQHGQWYRVLVSTFLHADPIHLVCNLVALWMAGVVLERLVGSAWLFSIYFVSAVAGSAASLAWNDAHTVGVGASGAVMGLFGAALLCVQRVPAGPGRTESTMQLMRVFIPSLIPIVTARGGGAVDFAAHFGGAVAGLAMGAALRKVWPRDRPTPGGVGVAKSLALLGLLCCLGSFVWMASDYSSNRDEIERALLSPP